MYINVKGLTKYNVCLVTVIGLEMLKNWPRDKEIFTPVLHSVHMKVNQVVFLSHFLQKTEINPTIMRRRCLLIVKYIIHEHIRTGKHPVWEATVTLTKHYCVVV